MASIIDIHAHLISTEYAQLFTRLGGQPPAAVRRYAELMRLKAGAPAAAGGPSLAMPPTDQDDDLTARLALMDEANVGVQVLSPATGAPYLEDEASAVDAARACNDQYAAVAAKHPDRFRWFVSLPLPHIEASVQELRRCDELGASGVTINCSVLDRSPAEDEYLPLYEEMDRRGSVLFFHPTVNGICSAMVSDFGLDASVGTSFEDTVVALQLVAKQIPHRFPNIKIVIPHFGGMLPMLLERLDNQSFVPPVELSEPISTTLRRFYYDTVGHGSQAALQCAWRAFGTDHLVAGSDYPVLLPFEGYKRTFEYITESELPPEAIDRILHHNGWELLGIER
jgi:predicted TIM-barrel fold metal-dependent hydrolase